jgi:hypothetical protein
MWGILGALDLPASFCRPHWAGRCLAPHAGRTCAACSWPRPGNGRALARARKRKDGRGLLPARQTTLGSRKRIVPALASVSPIAPTRSGRKQSPKTSSSVSVPSAGLAAWVRQQRLLGLWKANVPVCRWVALTGAVRSEKSPKARRRTTDPCVVDQRQHARAAAAIGERDVVGDLGVGKHRVEVGGALCWCRRSARSARGHGGPASRESPGPAGPRWRSLKAPVPAKRWPG